MKNYLKFAHKFTDDIDIPLSYKRSLIKDSKLI